MSATATPPTLALEHVSKTFGATRALVDASLHLRGGDVTALIGENGAGKSTLVKMLAGLHEPDAGEITIDGAAVRIRSPGAARMLGISVVHQESVVFDNLTVAENILIDALPTRGGFIARREMHRRASDILMRLAARIDSRCLVGGLSIAQKHLVQIARGLSCDARIVVLDEPTAALSHHEADELRRVIERLRQHGCAVLFISHKFEEIFGIADRYTVFRDGSTVGSGDIEAADTDALIRMMVGRDQGIETPDRSPPDRSPSATGAGAQEWPPDAANPAASRVVLGVSGFTREPHFRDVSFEARSGEVLGIYGLVGAGRTELMECVFGIAKRDAGAIVLDGTLLDLRSAVEAIMRGIAYVPEDRQRAGAHLSLSIAENIGLADLARLPFSMPRLKCAFAGRAREWMSSLSIKAVSDAAPLAELSGGNQQKVVLAKWLATQPRVLLLDEPTKGIDVGAKAAVHRLIRSLAAQGLAIVMVSSELPEVIALSDRMIVMRRGIVTGRFTREEATAELLARAATIP